ncbi:putative HTH-type transcriptional regulator YybR [mine drainage metagenome]|uniref:Putative HTH-type transcriptional regulator YybR n=1 Tax=mine drainage metagenome TaxID=410659 RepID=A0A1J5U049_9ZZZZ
MTLHKSKDPKSGLCPIRDVLDRLGDRWSLLVIHELEGGTLRFTELRKRIGDVSQRMLAQTLRRLEQDGLVSREVFASVPPRVEYTLTPLGHSLLLPLGSMIQWALDNHDAVRAARAAYVAPMAYAAN